MIQVLKQLFQQSIPQQAPQLSYQRAVAGLLMEVMFADHHIAPEEEISIKTFLKEATDLGDDVDVLYEEAKQGFDEATDLYQFTKVINADASHLQKFELVKGLWHVAYADGDLDAHEDHRIRRISELLFMPHSEFIQAKLAVQQELAQ